MNRQAISSIVRKDIKAITSSTQMWLPMVLLPLILVVILPVVFLVLGNLPSFVNTGNVEQIIKLLERLPEGAVKDQVMQFEAMNQKIAYMMLNYMLAPMFLIIPVMISTIISSNSFAGEKEKRTMETLLFSPVTEMELFISKILAAFIPAISISVICMIVYGTIIDTIGLRVFGRMTFPNLNWIVLLFWLIPAISLLSIFVCVLISAKVKGFQEAQQLSGTIVLPVVLLVFGQISGVMFLTAPVILFIGAVIMVVDIVLIRMTVRGFNREKLFSTQIS